MSDSNLGEVSNIKKSVSSLKKSICKIERLIKRYESSIASRPISLRLSLLDDLEKEFLRMSKMTADLTLDKWLKARRDEEKVKKDQLKSYLAPELEKLLKEKNFDLRGTYPALKTKYYRIDLDFEKERSTLWYGEQHEFLARVPLNANAIAQKIFAEDKRITQRRFDQAVFLQKLYEAYQRVINADGLPLGADVPIIRLLLEFCIINQNKSFLDNPTKENFMGYGRVYFSYDLYRLKEREINGCRLKLRTATLLQSKNKSQYLWIPSNEKGDGEIFASIAFEVQHNELA
ncbi:MAG: hypothetical protein ABC585_00445 [Candidatus Methanosuratincola petrocarbonis]